MGFAASTSTTCLLFLLLLLLPVSAVAQTNNGRVEVGASLTANNDASPWLSPSGDFAFGFHQHQNVGVFLVSIWFDKIPGTTKTLVWYAFENGSPVLAPAGSVIQLTGRNGLVLRNPRGEQLWRSDITMDEVGYAVMNDTGNFAIRSRNSDLLWQSFDRPTDTLLPTQIVEINGRLFSRRSENNFSQGRFLLSLQDDGNLVLSAVNLPTNLVYDGPYYSTSTNDAANYSNSGERLIFNESGEVYVLRKNNRRFSLATGATLLTPTADFYQRATLDFDGVFAQYYYPKRSSGEDRKWSTVWSKPDNICLRVGDKGSGACGFNSICSLNENGRPTCTCPPGFSLLDPDDKYGSCKQDVELSCRDDGGTAEEDLYDFKVLINTDWPRSDYEQFQPYNEQDCQTSCLHDCMCAVAIFREDSCWKKKLPLSNGREDSGVNGKAFIKVAKVDPTPPSVPDIPDRVEEKKQGTLIITGSILLGTSVFVNLALVAAFCLGVFSIYQKKFPIILTKLDWKQR
ncbi:G-type lectin S-receptor-like serine/threonine-protein kinase LECRK4 [Hibiscus syriacus]|uniref:G-type lectin S-receptor-like serine/threonine-protein kinase LECRK4 n=1 Tax=Hibiscus syriacus TaxID=106335 RepID=UPI0019244002|nr:G-type lectin S-receptor-like serine/threonine-protein kinase LECRK4 [Hibiscus syriacus]